MPIQALHGVYTIGPDVLPTRTGRPVAIAIRVCADLKVGDREFSAEINMHEAIALRKFYDALGGGTVRLTAYWPPGMQRLIPLTNEQLQRELDRMRTSFVVVQESGSTISIVDELFGPEPAEQVRRLHRTLIKQYEAWEKLLQEAKQRVDDRDLEPGLLLTRAYERMADTELEAIARLADPESTLPELVELPMLDTTEQQAAQEAVVEQADQLLERQVRHLEAAGLRRDQAEALIGIKDLYSELTDDVIADALRSSSKAKIATARSALQSLPSA